MEPAPTVGAGFFPLDEELQLPPSGLTPHAHQGAILLGTLMPFARAAEQLQNLLHVQVSVSTLRRLTEQAGAGLQAWQEAQAHPLGEEPPAETVASRLVLETDGVLVPVVGGEWAEVKMITIGEVDPTNEEEPHCEHLSYFARLTDAQTFADLASGEIRRRGIAQAEAVAAIQDGAEWTRPFVQSQRADALRILDFAHAAGYLKDIAALLSSADVDLPEEWTTQHLHALKHEGPTDVLAEVERQYEALPSESMREKVTYLRKREAQMQYPQYLADGWPLGSGAVESGNKLVVQARLKGAGMHWDRRQVNAMLALRTSLCSERWKEDWLHLQGQWQGQRLQRLRTHSQQRYEKAVRRLVQTFFGFPLSCVVACLPAPSPPPPPVAKGRTEGQRRWGRQSFSQRAIREGRYVKHESPPAALSASTDEVAKS